MISFIFPAPHASSSYNRISFSDKSNTFIGQQLTINSDRLGIVTRKILCDFNLLDFYPDNQTYTNDESLIIKNTTVPDELNNIFEENFGISWTQSFDKNLISRISPRYNLVCNLINNNKFEHPYNDSENNYFDGYYIKTFNEFESSQIHQFHKYDTLEIIDVIKEINFMNEGEIFIFTNIIFKCNIIGTNLNVFVPINNINKYNSCNLLTENFIEFLGFSAYGNYYNNLKNKIDFLNTDTNIDIIQKIIPFINNFINC